MDVKTVKTDTTILELRGIQKSYDRGTGKPLRVLEDVNLSIKSNEFVCLIGPSGCGKSTIMRIFAVLPRKGCWTMWPSCSRPSPCIPG